MENTTEILKELRKKLRTRENGPASEAMENLGIKYKKNHGLAIKEINEITKQYKFNHNLALELYNQGIRELHLMSFMIENPETIEYIQIENWLKNLTNTEQAEQIGINLLTETTQHYNDFKNLINIENEFAVRAVFVAIAKIAMLKNEITSKNIFANFLNLCTVKADTSAINIAKAISWAIRRIGRIDNNLRAKCLQLIENIKEQNYKHSQLIYSEVYFELTDEAIINQIEK